MMRWSVIGILGFVVAGGAAMGQTPAPIAVTPAPVPMNVAWAGMRLGGDL